MSQSNNKQPYDILTNLDSAGELELLAKGGVISTSVLLHYRIAKRMAELKRRKKFTMAGELVRDVAFEFQVKKTTVYKAIKIFSEINSVK